MLYFLQRPDETFHHIVREALVWLKEELTEGETNPEIQMMTAVLPKTSRALTLGPALATVDELLTALDRPEMYQLTPMHNLIISEALDRYCESYNDQPQETDVHARYGIHELDNQRMQTLFVHPSDAALRETPSHAKMEALQLTILADPLWSVPISPDCSPWCRKGEVYPMLKSEQ